MSRRSIEDLDTIWLYTVETWSREQANKYYQDLKEGINQLLKTPKPGRVLIEVDQSYRMYKVNYHLVVYAVEEDVIKVLRILHERMERRGREIIDE